MVQLKSVAPVAIAVAITVAIALATGYWWGQTTGSRVSTPPLVVRQEATALPQCPQPVAESETPPAAALCRSRYSGMGPVDLLALPTDFEQTVALYTVAAEADVAGLQDLIEQAMAISIEGERDAALSILYMRYSDLDPDGSIEHVYKMGLQGHASVLFVMFNGWAKTDLEAAIARSTKLRGPADRRNANRAILRAFASEDPAELAAIERRLEGHSGGYQAQALAQRARTEPQLALTTALTLDQPRVRRQAVRWIASVWADQDGETALAQADRIDDAQLRDEYRQAVLSRMAVNAPVATLRRVGQGSTGEDRMIIASAMGVLAQKNPNQALAAISQLPTPSLRLSARQQLMSNWSQHDPAAAALALENMSDLSLDQRIQLGHQITSTFAQRDPAGALAWASRMEGQNYGQLWHTAVTTIAHTDPELAMATVAQLPASAQQTDALINLIGAMARNDPISAIARLADLPASDTQARAVSGIAAVWVETDPVAAMDWLMTLPEATREQGVQHVAWRLAASDPLLAASYTADLRGDSRSAWISAVVNSYAKNDASEAALWLGQYSDEPQYGDWMGMVAMSMAARDPRAAVKLLNRLEDGPFNAALPGFIGAWAQLDAPAAGAWWHRLKPSRQNMQALHQLVRIWHRYDPPALEKWVLRLSNSNHRDTALAGLVGTDPTMTADHARRLIDHIDSPDLRFEAISSQLWQLARFDRAQAEEFLRRARLAPDRREQLLQQLQYR